MEQAQTKYTVFCDEVGSSPGFWPGGEDLQETIEAVLDSSLKLIPTAWAPVEVGLRLWERLYAESIAAGRVIELVDGKYVPRGVPVASTTPTLDKLEAEWVTRAKVRVAEKRAADPNYAMIARDGPAKPKREPLPHFNQRTDFDNFGEGYRVRSFHNWMVGEERAANQGPLQRISSMSHMLGNGIKG